MLSDDFATRHPNKQQQLTVINAPAYINGQRAPFNGPSESQPHDRAMTMKMAVLGSGTGELSAMQEIDAFVTYSC
jgi:hypothetical protein